jgi:phosphoglycolate phosphatase
MEICGHTRRWPAAIVFDLDGTLVDSAADIASALNDLLAGERLPVCSVEETVGFIGGGIWSLVERAFGASGGLSGRDLSRLVARYSELYSGSLTAQTREYIGVSRLLRQLRASGIRLGLCTNKEQSLAEAIASDLSLDGFFDVIVGGYPGRPQKPSPFPLLHAISLLGVAPDQTVMVGDSIGDIRCADAAGVAFLGVSFGYSRPSLRSLGAKVVIDCFSEFDAGCQALQGNIR